MELPSEDAIVRKIRIKLPRDLQEGARHEEYAVPVPVAAFVSAPGIIDWRDGRAGVKNGRSSKQVISDYAHKSGRTAPPIRHVRVYLRPDGGMYAALLGDGAHRLCAAKRRHDEAIYCQSVTICQLR